MTATSERDPVIAPQDEHALLEEIERFLRELPPRPAKLVGPDGTETELPGSVYEILVQAVRELVIGNGVSILPAEMELTTQRAADLLNVSRPHVIDLINRGELPHHLVGTHRRLRLADVLAYRARRDAVRRAALDELTRDAEEDGLYERFYRAGRQRLARSSSQR
jgi:excisionase family DNA binding protein